MKAIKNNVILIMLVFFLSLVIGTIYRIYTAFDTHPGLIVESAYKSGEKYTDILNNQSKVVDSGWSVNLTTSGALVSSNPIRFLAESKHDFSPDQSSEFKIFFFRPLEEIHDFDMIMAPSKASNNSFEATAKLPLKGVWDVVVEGTYGDLIHRVSRRLFLKE